jgi:hypothetical protein
VSDAVRTTEEKVALDLPAVGDCVHLTAGCWTVKGVRGTMMGYSPSALFA